MVGGAVAGATGTFAFGASAAGLWGAFASRSPALVSGVVGGGMGGYAASGAAGRSMQEAMADAAFSAILGGVLGGVTSRLADDVILAGVMGRQAATSWRLGSHKSDTGWANRMRDRGWTNDTITEAIAYGRRFPAPNKVRPQGTATRYVHPRTGKSVVVDDQTYDVLHIGNNNCKYD